MFSILMNDKTQNNKKIIFVNRKEITVTEDKLDGEQILALARLDSNEYDLFLVRGQDSKKIDAKEILEIKDGMRFNAILKSVPYG